MFFDGHRVGGNGIFHDETHGAVRGNLVHNGLQLAARSDYEYEGLSGSG